MPQDEISLPPDNSLSISKYLDKPLQSNFMKQINEGYTNELKRLVSLTDCNESGINWIYLYLMPFDLGINRLMFSFDAGRMRYTGLVYEDVCKDIKLYATVCYRSYLLDGQITYDKLQTVYENKKEVERFVRQDNAFNEDGEMYDAILSFKPLNQTK